MTYKLGLLDQSPIFHETNGAYALQHTISLAQQAEKWGYHRFWVAEHHHMEHLAGSSPEVLISHLLAKTETIRIGSGGVMLQHYSPFKVAENFHVLASLTPNRVDLGVGKAPGGFPLSTKALQFGTVGDGSDFEERFTLLTHFIHDTLPESHSLAGIQVVPLPAIPPSLFLLGGSEGSASYAASLGVHFVFARFINSDDIELEKAANVFKEQFPNGKLLVSVAVVAAETKEEAEALAKDHKLYVVQLQSGRTYTVQSLDQANAFAKQATEPFEIVERDTDIIAGTPDDIKATLDRLHEAYGVDEFIVHTPLRYEKERWKSFELLRPHALNTI